MTTQYTTILKLALPVQGELSGSWGDVVNDNITEMVEEAVAGLATINSWTANSHTLTTANGTTSESRCAVLVADDDGGGNPSAAATIICPAATKLYVLKNISGQQVTLKTSGGTGVAVPNGSTAFLFCDGTNVEACQTDIIDATTIDTTNLEVTNIKAKDGTASGSIANSTGVFTINSAVLTTADITGNLTVDTNTLFVNAASNRVGIGTSSPATQLEVNGTIRASGSVPILSILDTTAATDEKEWHIRGADGPLRFAAINEASGASGDFVEFTRVGNSGRTIRGVRSGATSYELSNFGRSLFFSGGVSTIGTATAHDLVFDTNNTEKMRITSAGLVGIGNAAPSYLLDLYKAASTVARIRNSAATGGTPSATHGEFVIESTDANMGMQFLGSTTADQRILFSDTGAASGQIVYNHTSNYMALSTATAERMRIDSSGNVGIGTAAPAQPLQVEGNIRGGSPTVSSNYNFSLQSGSAALTNLTRYSGGLAELRHYGGAFQVVSHDAYPLTLNTSNAERMRISDTGLVGIGTSTPSVLLDVLGDGLIQRLRSTTSTAAYLRFDGTGTSFPFVGLLNGIGTFGNTDASPIRFMTNSSERMRITNTGNVGIGTNSPAVPLDVQCDTAAFGLQLRGRSADNISVLRFRNNAADTTYFQLDIRATSSNLNTVANVPMLFSTNNTERMRIDQQRQRRYWDEQPFTASSSCNFGGHRRRYCRYQHNRQCQPVSFHGKHRHRHVFLWGYG